MSQSRAKDRSGQAADGRQPDEGLVPLSPEERARLIAELEADLAAAERSVREEGTISAEEFLKQRKDYWAGLAKRSDDNPDDPSRPRRR